MGVAKERLFFNADKSKIVKEDDPSARTLAAAAGDEIPDVEKPAKAEGVTVTKEAEKPADKAVKKAANK